MSEHNKDISTLTDEDNKAIEDLVYVQWQEEYEQILLQHLYDMRSTPMMVVFGMHPEEFLVCKYCGTEFTMYHDEVSFFQKRGFVSPKRCKTCRQKRKAK
jgi:hypothetical protein